jgi:hypothetical protein
MQVLDPTFLALPIIDILISHPELDGTESADSLISQF